MKSQTMIRNCPLCGSLYNEPPAISRVDNKTLICPDCGTRQALEGLGIGDDEREKILEIIHKNTHKVSE